MLAVAVGRELVTAVAPMPGRAVAGLATADGLCGACPAITVVRAAPIVADARAPTYDVAACVVGGAAAAVERVTTAGRATAADGL